MSSSVIAAFSPLLSRRFYSSVSSSCLISTVLVSYLPVGCRAIAYLADGSRENSAKLCAAGALEAIMHAVKAHKAMAGTCKWGCRAISNLIEGGPESMSKFGASGACEAVIRLLKVHTANASVVVQACRAVAYLGLDEENKNMFRSIGNLSLPCIMLNIILKRYQLFRCIRDRSAVSGGEHRGAGCGY